MSTAFTGFVLLNEAKFDREKFLKDLKDDWKITLDLGKEDESKEKDMLVGDIDGIKIGNISGNVDTIDHEVLCNINRRVNRVYLTNEDKYTVNYVLD